MAGKGNGSGYRIGSWVWTLDLSPTQKLVMLALANHADGTYTSFPSMPTIARETGLGRSTVARTIVALEEADVILRASRSRGDGSTTSNRYYLNHPDAPHVTGELDDAAMLAEVQQAARRAIGSSPVVDGVEPEVIARERRTGLVPEGAEGCARCGGTGYVDGAEACDHDTPPPPPSRSETGGPSRSETPTRLAPGRGASRSGTGNRTNPLTNPLTHPRRTELSPEPGTSLRVFDGPTRRNESQWEEARGA